MKNKNIKIFSIIAIATIVLLITMSFVYATSIGGVSINPDISSGAAKTAGNVGNVVLGVIQVAGTAIAVGMLLILGIRYISASPEGKADIKKSSVIYIIGAVILFAAANLANVIYKFAQQAVPGN